MSNPVSGRGLKYSASRGTVPKRTGQCSGRRRPSAGSPALTWLFMVTLGTRTSSVSHQQDYGEPPEDKRGLRNECLDLYTKLHIREVGGLHLTGADEQGPRDAVVVAVDSTKTLWLLRLNGDP